jgi:hypothetical protein
MVKSFGRKKKSTTGSVIGHPDEEGLTKEQHPINRLLDEKAEGKSMYNFKKGKLRTGKARLLRLRLASVFSAAKKKDKLTKEERAEYQEEQNFDPPYPEELEESSRAYGDSYGDWKKTGKEKKRKRIKDWHGNTGTEVENGNVIEDSKLIRSLEDNT